jgi:hypothetical protein
MIFLTDRIVLNSIARGDDGCFHVMNAFLVSGAVQFTYVSSPAIMHCKNWSP